MKLFQTILNRVRVLAFHTYMNLVYIHIDSIKNIFSIYIVQVTLLSGLELFCSYSTGAIIHYQFYLLATGTVRVTTVYFWRRRWTEANLGA